MNWGSFEQFAHMGGYGLYVWGSYAVTFVLLAVELVSLVKRKKSIEQQMTRQQIKREITK
jgi:heme exporter protein D